MCYLTAGLVTHSVCANMRLLRCAIRATALRTASSWRYAAAFIGSSACWLRFRCKAFLPAPVMVSSLIKGSLKRWLTAWCAGLCVAQPSCCCRVYVVDQPTSFSLPACRGQSMFMFCCMYVSGFGEPLFVWACITICSKAATAKPTLCDALRASVYLRTLQLDVDAQVCLAFVSVHRSIMYICDMYMYYGS